MRSVTPQPFAALASTLPAPPYDSDVFRAASATLPKPPPRPTFWSFPKRCGACGAVYTAAEWAALPDRRDWDMRPHGDFLEQRRCPCGSHVCVTLEE